MTAPPSITRWPRAIRAIHWLTALLVVTTIPAVYGAMALTEVDTDAAERLIGMHILCGLLILVLTLTRLVLRLALARPTPAGSPALRLAASATAVLLYVMLLSLPVTGVLKLTLSGLDVSAFGIVLVPSFERAPQLARALNTLHAWIGNGLILVAVAHAGMAVLHDRVTGAAVLGRMI